MLTAIAVKVPAIVKDGLFSSRRTDRALSSEEPVLSVMNAGIASGQVLNGVNSVADIARESATNSNNLIAQDIVSAEEKIKEFSKSGKIIKGTSKVIQFIADHINPVICLAGGVKVLVSDNKKDAAIEECAALATMFVAENTAKAILGMPKNYKLDGEKIKIIDDSLYKIKDGNKELLANKENYKVIGNKVTVMKDGLYKKNPFLKKQSEALQDYFSTKQIFNSSLKHVPSALKGVGFVCASIGGYALGSKIGKTLTGND